MNTTELDKLPIEQFNSLPREEIILYHFEKLKDHLLVIRSPAKKQMEIFNQEMIGVCLEAEYSCHYIDYRSEFLELGILNQHQCKILDTLNAFFQERACKDETDGCYFFWTENTELCTHADWEKVREIARECLKVLN